MKIRNRVGALCLSLLGAALSCAEGADGEAPVAGSGHKSPKDGLIGFRAIDMHAVVSGKWIATESSSLFRQGAASAFAEASARQAGPAGRGE